MAHGIKELKELADGIEILLLFILQQSADGLDFSDVAALVSRLMTDKEFSEKVAEAFGGLGAMKEEVLDLDYKEAAELGQYILGKVC